MPIVGRSCFLTVQFECKKHKQNTQAKQRYFSSRIRVKCRGFGFCKKAKVLKLMKPKLTTCRLSFDAKRGFWLYLIHCKKFRA